MIEDRFNELSRRFDAVTQSRPRLLFAFVAVLMAIVTLLLLMGAPPAVVYQAF
jgi:hypothetical protein